MMKKKILLFFFFGFLFTSIFSTISTSSVCASSPLEFLKAIRIPQAWQYFPSSHSPVTIALVDTGIDFKHKDLKGLIVPGINLLDPAKPPEDDNGHGTKVAGIFSTIKKNSASKKWNVKLMPVKALDQNGEGKEETLIQGINYAVAHRAQIVVLSLGLYYSSESLKKAVEFAERKGVILVAAAGNEALDLENKVAVKYPAAYPSVISVGGGDPKKFTRNPRSNYGFNLNLLASWKVNTTALNGGYKEGNGTSMAAPQVGAVAGMLLSMHPKLKPFEIRNILLQTAKPTGPDRWGLEYGFGFLQADAALKSAVETDFHQNNHSIESADPFPINTTMISKISGILDQDWFYVDFPYDGRLRLKIESLKNGQTLQIYSFLNSQQEEKKNWTLKANGAIEIPVKKGRRYLQFTSQDFGTLSYAVRSEFYINPDLYEPNNRKESSTPLSCQNQKIVGSFDHEGDVDWYKLNVDKPTRIRIKLSTDSALIDPAFEFTDLNGQITNVDEFDGNLGETESMATNVIQPGTYYIKVYNASSLDSSPVEAQYHLIIECDASKMVHIEISDSFDDYIKTGANEQHFKIIISDESESMLSINQISSQLNLRLFLYDEKNRLVERVKIQHAKEFQKRLAAGAYSLVIKPDTPDGMKQYRLKLENIPLSVSTLLTDSPSSFSLIQLINKRTAWLALAQCFPSSSHARMLKYAKWLIPAEPYFQFYSFQPLTVSDLQRMKLRDVTKDAKFNQKHFITQSEFVVELKQWEEK